MELEQLIMPEKDRLERILKLAQFSFADGGGGAAKAAYRLHSALGDIGVDARLYVLRKETDDPSVSSLAAQSRWRSLAPELAWRFDQVPRMLFGSKTHFYSTGYYGAVTPAILPAVRDADVICLYWTTRGLLSIRDVGRLLKTGKPIVWRLSDMWPFTGGCHYSGDCNLYSSTCGKCPQIGSKTSFDLSSYLQRSKLKHWSQGNLTVVAPSRWMAEKAQQSKLFRNRPVKVISTGVDCEIFRPISRATARDILRLPQDRALILLGATGLLSDPRKGRDVIAPLILAHSNTTDNGAKAPGFVLFGTSQRPEAIPARIPVFPMGIIRDESMLSLVYSACDVFIAPSHEENLANTVLEAMACGLPILAYRVGGMSDAVEHDVNGLLYVAGDYNGLVSGLTGLLRDASRMAVMSKASRERALLRFSLAGQAEQYKSLFLSLAKRN